MTDEQPEAPKTPKVVSLDGSEVIPPGEPRPDVVKLAEEVLEHAKSGDLAGLAVVMEHHDDTHTNEYQGRPCSYGTIGAIERLKHRMVRTLD